MRAGKIFINDLKAMGVLEKVKTVKITLYGSLAATGKGHHTPQAILLGLEGSDPETIDTGTIPSRYSSILEHKQLLLGGSHLIHYDSDRDMLWRFDQVLKTHPNGMRFMAFDNEGDLIATNEYFSVGGGFVVNEKTKVGENLFYKGVDKRAVHGARLHQTHSLTDPATHPTSIHSPALETEALSTNDDEAQNTSVMAGRTPDPMDEPFDPEAEHPPYPFVSGNSLLALTQKHNMTIAQIVYDNEKYFGYTDDDIHDKLMRIWQVMDECIHTGVSSSERTLPGRLGLRRRAPMLYRRLMRGFYPGISQPTLPAIAGATASSSEVISPPNTEGDTDLYEDGVLPGGWGAREGLSSKPFSASSPQKNAGSEKLADMRRKRSPAARVVGSFDHAVLPMPPRKTVIPAMDFLSCYAIAVNEVNASGGRIVTSPTNGAAGVIPAVLKYILEFVSDDPEKSITTFLLTAAAVGMLFKRGSTISAAEGGCQAEVGGIYSPLAPLTTFVLPLLTYGRVCLFVQSRVRWRVPGLQRAWEAAEIGIAVKAVTAAQLSMASHGVYSVTLDEAIEAMRLTATDMSVKYKETSMSVSTLDPSLSRL
ncbi:hypothetical protein EYR38_008945 [Pleurotus pulmonarius]|nr:hypothetical protein EYR38_008945 [Pleurotus pulmonarius]